MFESEHSSIELEIHLENLEFWADTSIFLSFVL